MAGSFAVAKNHGSIALLNELGISPNIDKKVSSILVRRHVSASLTGKSLAWINDISVTLPTLRRLGYLLIDIFGQHENQRLLNPTEHLHYLDQLVGDKELPMLVERQYQACVKSLRELENMVANFKTRSREKDYLQFRVNELRNFCPDVDDFSKLRNICLQFTNQATIHEKLTQSQSILDQGVSGQPINGALSRLISLIDELDVIFPKLGQLKNQVEPIIAVLDDFSYELEKTLSGFQIDEQEYEVSQNRIAEYQNYFRKLSVDDPDGLKKEQERLEEELSFIENASEILQNRLQELHTATLELKRSCLLLTKERKKQATYICRYVEQEMNELGMKGAKFDVEFAPTFRPMSDLDFSDFGDKGGSFYRDTKNILENTSALGMEKVQFLLSSNLGEPAKPLTKIASGGELSRIMLALKKVLTAGAETCVLVFDEIDAGISGRIADIVGKKMKELSNHFQIICISHLPQVAVHANRHLLVEKYQKKQKTESRIVPLCDESSAREIARLLSGVEITDQSIKNAKALVEKARTP